ncbi:MAG: GDP-mannose 4,6-dehydratase, partial [Ferruginibacter sp.]
GYVLKEIIETFSRLTSTSISYKIKQENFRPSENKKIIGSFEKIKNELGWQPTIPMEQSLKDLMHYWQSKN